MKLEKGIVEVRRKSPRFQLVRREIESLRMDGVYHFFADAESPMPIEYRATRRQLEETFAQAMSTPSYRERGLFHQAPWPLADQFRVTVPDEA